MRIRLLDATVVIATLTVAVGASARSWRVELDGTGDFVDIQPAVDASANGDTILIGPGRFDTFHPCVAPAWTEQTVIWITKDNLTLLGSGQGVTVIGPATYYAPLGRDPKGICSIDGKAASISGLSIENIDTGIYWWRGSLLLEDCTISGGTDQSFNGLALWPFGATIRNCTVDTRFAGYSCLVGQQSSDILFEDCTFKGFGYGPEITNGSTNVQFAGCEFLNVINGLYCDQQSTVDLSDCTFQAISSFAISVLNDSRATLDRVTIDGASTGILAAGGGIVSGTNIVVKGAWSEAVRPCCNSFVTIRDSHILAMPGGLAVRCVGTWAHTQYPNMTGNYWGTIDADAIHALIWDANDTSETNGLVTFVPFAGGEVPTESKSWGDLKILWR